jgi:hypothetical protein
MVVSLAIREDPTDRWTDTDTDRQHGDLISLLLFFFSNEESRPITVTLSHSYHWILS